MVQTEAPAPLEGVLSISKPRSVHSEVGLKIPAPEGTCVNPALKARSSTAQGEGCSAAETLGWDVGNEALKGRRSKAQGVSPGDLG